MQGSELEKQQAAFYANVPELIDSFGPWETVKACDSCGEELTDYMPCLYATTSKINPQIRNGGDSFEPSKIACPHCGIFPNHLVLFSDTKRVSHASSIKFKIVKRRKVWITRPGWWARLWGAKEKWFYEYVSRDGGGHNPLGD